MTQIEILLKYHEIQRTALNEIKEMIAVRDISDVRECRTLLADIEDVAAFASTVSFTNPHYDGYKQVEEMAFNPQCDILIQAKAVT